MRRLTVLLLVVVMAALAAPAVAAASKLIVRNATHITLKVNAKNRAVVSFRAKGIVRHVLVWGAINAKPPDRAHPDSQVKFHVDYSGGSASPWGGGYWRRVKNACTRWRGSGLTLAVTVCTLPDGSHWALQSWKRLMPNGGYKCCQTPQQGKRELHISHWKGPLAQLWLQWNWTRATSQYPHLDKLFGRARPVPLQPELGERTLPERDVQLALALLRCLAALVPAVRHQALPALERPVGAVRHRADRHGQRDAAATPAGARVLDAPPVAGAPGAGAATRVVDVELDLAIGMRPVGRLGVDRAPYQHVADDALGAVADHRPVLGVHLERDVRRVADDQFAGSGDRRGRERGHDHHQEQDCESSHLLLYRQVGGDLRHPRGPREERPYGSPRGR